MRTGMVDYHIDKAFLDLSGFESAVSLLDFGHQVKDRVAQFRKLRLRRCASCRFLLSPPENYELAQSALGNLD